MSKTNVKVIEPIVHSFESISFEETVKPKKRTAAYARVSTDNEEQKTSYEAQIDEYEKRIKRNPDWEFMGVFADEGISGTSLNKRDEFNRMIEMAKAGELDLIITKSISRFARNTELTLKTVRELKEIGVEVYFEKENLWTFDSKVELFLTIFSSIAQEEARNISENVTWNVKKRMREGVAIVNCKRFMGYTKDEEGKLIIEPSEAKIVKMVFELYTSGVGPSEICRSLTQMGIKTGAGKDKWTSSTLLSILTNEKYVGDLLLQKTYTVDYLTHKRMKNKDKLAKYLIENNHPAIIDRKTFELAQQIRTDRRNNRIGADKNLAKYDNKYPLSHNVICLKCGNTLKRHYWNHGYPSQCVVRLCGNYLNGRDNCDAKGIKEELIEKACLETINYLFIERDDILDLLKKGIKKNIQSTKIDSQLDDARDLKESLENELSRIIDLKIKGTEVDSKILESKYMVASIKLQEQNQIIKTLEKESLEDYKSTKRLSQISKFIKEQKETVTSLDSGVFEIFINKIIAVAKDEIIIFLTNFDKADHLYFVENRKKLIKSDIIHVGEVKVDRFKDILKYKVAIL